MDWNLYKSEFERYAESNGYDSSYTERCLKYAHRLHEQNLPIIYSLEHLASLVGLDESYLRFVSYDPNKFYRSFSVKKNSGGERQIDEPLPNLKLVQRWILENILYRLEPSPFAKAFVPGRSIKDNAKFHRNKPMVLTLDIKDFFPSISSARINSFFKGAGYSPKVCYFLTRLCTLNGSLPQGAPTSAALSNLVFLALDRQIATYCINKDVRYTRYADDLTFSGQFVVSEIINFTRSALSTLGFRLNDNKTRLMRSHERQQVTGIVVNRKLQIPREVRRSLRQAVYFIERFGLDNHVARLNECRANYLLHLLGEATFIRFINPNDRDAEKAISVLHEIRNSQLSFV
ncbi:retron St85 family RNA-directed DNA polymerase [Undibacterium sp. Ji49W]|uniref:retron St85 family RNA-directed DNA polymerase n=1 Tax=Undibacterium sp. Ji49W TaxID=3413040 RepID=UPI003BF3822E